MSKLSGLRVVRGHIDVVGPRDALCLADVLCVEHNKLGQRFVQPITILLVPALSDLGLAIRLGFPTPQRFPGLGPSTRVSVSPAGDSGVP